jgi:hypothetical protein
MLDEFDRDFLTKLRSIESFQWKRWRFRMAHATPEGSLYEYLPMDRWKERVEGLSTDYVLIGHTHIQGMRSFGNITVVNPGSVGLARDVPGETCYAVCAGGRMRLESVPYEVSRTLADLRKGPIPRKVIEGLVANLNPGASGLTVRRRGSCQFADQRLRALTARATDALRDGDAGDCNVRHHRRDRPEDIPGPKTRPSTR